MKWKARYQKKGISPFDPEDFGHVHSTAFIVAEIDDSIPKKEVAKIAKRDTPKDFEFIEVVKVKDES